MAKVIPIVRIVDDDETFCMSQKMFLQAMGWFVLIYNSAKTFLEDDDPSQPGCLILDMRMPDMTGLELQTALVARGAPLPIIFLTGHGDVNMAVHALQHGAFDFLQKPVDPEKLNEVVSRAVEHSIALHEQTRSEEMIRALYDSLTAREQDVVKLAAMDMSNKARSSSFRFPRSRCTAAAPSRSSASRAPLRPTGCSRRSASSKRARAGAGTEDPIMTFARSKSKEGPDRLRRRLLVAGAAAALCPAHALAGHREDLQQDWDVIVIGTGMAGLTAAVSAREAGAVRVLLLEKGPLVGGHTLYAAGSVAVLSPRRQAPIGFTDSVELWIQDAIKAGGTVLRPHITRIATESEAAVDWLEGLGLVMTRTAYQAVGDMHPRSVTALGLAAGRRFVIALHENARMLGVTTALNTRAVRLGRAEEDGLVRVAVKRTLPGGEVRDEVLRAGGIVIATGGFTADVGRRLLYDDRLTVDVPTTANPQGLYFDGATGDGLDLGAMVGGHTVGMSNIILLPYAGGRLLDYVGGDIYVNSSGERFMNEAMPIYDISEAILAQSGRTCWVITDSRSRKGGTLGLKLADGTVRRSNTIEEMARAMDVPVNTLRRTISEYNEDVAKGLDRRFGKRIFTQAIDSPPYYWGRESVYVHMTLGGLAVSPEARLLDRRGMPIPGFWAAGETTGGIFGRGRPGGMSLITCLVQGRDAGRAAAERSLALKPKVEKVEK